MNVIGPVTVVEKLRSNLFAAGTSPSHAMNGAVSSVAMMVAVSPGSAHVTEADAERPGSAATAILYWTLHCHSNVA